MTDTSESTADKLVVPILVLATLAVIAFALMYQLYAMAGIWVAYLISLIYREYFYKAKPVVITDADELKRKQKRMSDIRLNGLLRGSFFVIFLIIFLIAAWSQYQVNVAAEFLILVIVLVTSVDSLDRKESDEISKGIRAYEESQATAYMLARDAAMNAGVQEEKQ